MASISNLQDLTDKIKTKVSMADPCTPSQMKDALDRMTDEIVSVLPERIRSEGTAQRYARQLMTLHRSDALLRKCSLGSQIRGLMSAAALGLDMTPSLGQCFLVPCGDTAQFVLGYKGCIDLSMRSGQIRRVFADVVCEKDKFSYSKGLNASLVHEEWTESEDRGGKKFVYALAEFVNGGYTFDVWPVSRVNAHAKRFSKTFSALDSPWVTDWDSMAKKTLLLSIWKYMPVSTDCLYACAADDSDKNLELITPQQEENL